MTEIKNTSDVRQAVHTVNGVVFIPPGKTRKLELTDPGKAFVERSEVLVVVEAKPKAPKAKGKSEG